MNSDLTLSVVIPTFNMELYLPRCLSSVCTDEIKGLAEVIVVNDGSTDTSLSIASSFKEKHPDIVRIIDKPNENYGSCINSALKTARGKYIKILDADDKFETEPFIRFVNYLNRIDTDLVLSDFSKVDMESNPVKTYRYAFLPFKSYRVEELIDIDEMWMHAVTYRTKNLVDMDYHQTEGISYTDQEWIFLPMTSVHEFHYFPEILYLYTCGRDGQTIDPKVFAGKISDEIKGFKVMMGEYLSVSCENDNLSYLVKRLVIRAKTIYSFGLIYYLGKISLDTIIEFDKFIRDNSDYIYSLTEDLDAPIKVFSIKFVELWRKSGYKIRPIFRILNLYKTMRNMITSR